MKRIAMALLGMGLAALIAGLAPVPAAAQGRDNEQAKTQDPAALGKAVYVAACATCHGLKGDGKGPQSVGFAQHPTDFTKGEYVLRSTTDDVPAPGDLERTIREGMSGTEMVPFGHVLSERSIAAVAAYVRAFSPDLADPEAVPDEDTIVKVPPRPFPRTEQTIEQGQQVWEDNSCSDCHGDEGEGNPDETDSTGLRVVMVPFQDGYYKSGPKDSDLYRSIATGMTGTSMDAYEGEVSSQNIWKLVDYIRSLSASERQGLIGRTMDFFLRTRPSGFDYSNYDVAKP